MDHFIDELIARLESVAEGDATLSEDVLKSLGWHWECMGCPGGGLWKDPHQGLHYGPLPTATETVEAARALAPDNVYITAHGETDGCWRVDLHGDAKNGRADFDVPAVTARARTLALALCSALVKWQFQGHWWNR